MSFRGPSAWEEQHANTLAEHQQQRKDLRRLRGVLARHQAFVKAYDVWMLTHPCSQEAVDAELAMYAAREAIDADPNEGE